MNILDSQIGEILRYRDVNDFWRVHNIPSRRVRYVGQYWRLADGSLGWVCGIEGLNGIACVTDGVVLIVRDVNGRLFDCHLDSWVRDKSKSMSASVASGSDSLRSDSNTNSNSSSSTKANKKLLVLLEEFL